MVLNRIHVPLKMSPVISIQLTHLPRLCARRYPQTCPAALSNLNSRKLSSQGIQPSWFHPHRRCAIKNGIKTESLLRPKLVTCQAEVFTRHLVHTLSYKVDRYQGVHCDLGDIPDYVTPEQFDVVLKESLWEWKNSGKCSIWLQIPIVMGQTIPVAAKYGFEFHHAEGDTAVLSLWLRSNVPNKLPPYATHQVGVSGVVLKEETQEVLVVKDRNRPFTLWKFPGGLSDLGEDIGHTAEREIEEETGIKTEFCGVLAFRQQHDHPNAFGRSDLFFVCHMIPLTFDLVPCTDEIEDCRWMHINELAKNEQTSAITKRMIRLMRIGMRRGFEHVDLKADEFQSVYKGLKFKIYNRWLPETDEEVESGYSHSMASPEQVLNQK